MMQAVFACLLEFKRQSIEQLRPQHCTNQFIEILFAAPAYEGRISLDIVCDADQVLSHYRRQITALDHISQSIRRAKSTLAYRPDSCSSGLTIPRGTDLQAARSIISKVDISTVGPGRQVCADPYCRVVPFLLPHLLSS